ncbi:MAG: flagellar hook-length control protein FliK [Pseudomonadota bacterium]
MTVAPTAATFAILPPAGGAAALPAWQPGQRLNAVVVGQSAPQTVSLRIGAYTVEANTSTPLALRTPLQLEVVQGGAQPVLRIVQTAPGADPLTTALRGVLPQQLPLQQVFTVLHGLFNASGVGGLPAPALHLFKQLLDRLPGADRVFQTGALQQALDDSGILLENKLSRGDRTRLDGDIKANLLRLLATLPEDDQHGGDLRRSVSAALARIELHQLSTLTEPARDITTVTAELPLRRPDGVDVFQLQIDKHSRQGDDASGPAWTVWLNFEIASLGPVHAKLTLTTDHQVSSLLWAEQPAASALITRHLNWLEQALSAAGLTVGQLHCFTGSPPRDPSPKLPSQLVDMRA